MNPDITSLDFVPTVPDMQHLMVQFVLQLAVIIIAARLGGSLFHRWFGLPRVLGELVAGMVIGPYALGGVDIPLFGRLFHPPLGPIPVSPELYGIATLASIVLLFLAGLDTDLATFIRYSVAGTLVGFCGVFFSFILGDLCTLWFGLADSFTAPEALFMGAISTATSVGITARILTEKRKTHTPEGVTIMAAAIFDDVLGIVILAIVVGLSRFGFEGGSVPWGHILRVAAKAFGFWLACTAVGLLTAKWISRALKMSRTPATVVSLSLGLALLLAGLSEAAGLAMIIGAYIMGLSLSRTDLVHFLREELRTVHDLFVPVFFCVMGMLVNLRVTTGVVAFGAAYSLLAIAAKVIGCGAPAALSGFNLRGAYRIGLGMLPRGEVALIVASVGLTAGVVEPHYFGVAIMMTVVTTLLAPPMLYHAFEGGAGVKGEAKEGHVKPVAPITLGFPSADIAEFLMNRVVKAFRQEEFFVHGLPADTPSYQIRKEDLSFTLTQHGPDIILMAAPDQQHVARLVLLEELLSLQDLLESSRNMESLTRLQNELARDLFEGEEDSP